MTEREHIEAAQKDLASLKEHLRAIRTINTNAGRAAEANAAFLALSRLNVWHGETTKDLLALWPQWASDVVVLGGGGR